MRRARETQIEREAGEIVRALLERGVCDGEAHDEPVLVQRRPGSGAETAREVKRRKAGIARDRGQRGVRADVGGETLADRVDARGVARVRCDGRCSADQRQDLERHLIARQRVVRAQHGVRGAMQCAMRPRIGSPRLGGLAGETQRVRDGVRIEPQRDAVVAVIGRMRDAIRFVRVEEQDRIRVGDRRSQADVVPKQTSPRENERRQRRGLFAGAVVRRARAAHVGGIDQHDEKRTISKARPLARRQNGRMTMQSFSDQMPGLAADGPDPELGEAADLFAPLIGDWQMRTSLMPLDGPQVELEGFWSFRWGLGGRAVYDVIGFRAAGSPPEAPHRTGLTVRFHDGALGTWRQVWVGVPRGVILEFVARREGSRIVIDGAPSTTQRYRWSFETITPTSFAWEGRVSRDGGATWYLEQTITGTR
jgi:hypothetical protein